MAFTSVGVFLAWSSVLSCYMYTSAATSDKTTLKRKRKILGVNSIASKKSKGADSCPKPSRDSAGAVLKTQSQAGKEQPKMKQKQRMPKVKPFIVVFPNRTWVVDKCTT